MFKKLDVRKMRIREDPPATLATSATQADDSDFIKSSKSSGSSSLPLSNSHFCDSISSDDPKAEITTSYREGPPYPDSLGRVKCFYCAHCEINGHKATCRVSGESRAGIALLIECSDFAMTTVDPGILKWVFESGVLWQKEGIEKPAGRACS